MIKKPASVFDGDDFCISRILARQSSSGHSSHDVLDPSPCQATVPFEWEMRPGTPKNPQQEQMLPPLSPPPSLMHSMGHHLSSIDRVDCKGSTPKTSKVWSLEKTVRKIIKVVLIPSKRRSRSQQENSSRFGYLTDGEFVASSFSSSSSSSVPSDGRFDVHLSGSLRRDSTVGVVRCIPGKMTASLARIARRF